MAPDCDTGINPAPRPWARRSLDLGAPFAEITIAPRTSLGQGAVTPLHLPGGDGNAAGHRSRRLSDRFRGRYPRERSARPSSLDDFVSTSVTAMPGLKVDLDEYDSKAVYLAATLGTAGDPPRRSGTLA